MFDEYYFEILKELDKERVRDIDIKAYIQKVFNLVKKHLGIEYAELTFEYMEKDIFGKSDNRSVITINRTLLNLSNIHDLTQSIFHESRHIYQAKNNKIEIDSKMKPTIPLIFSDQTIFYLSVIFTPSQCYNLYYTTITEKDARDYANNMCETLYNFLQKNTKNINAQKLSQILKTANEQSVEIEDKKYKRCMYDLNYNMKEIADKVKNELNENISVANKQVKFLKKYKNSNVCNYADSSENDIIQSQITHIKFSLLMLNLKLCALVSVYCDEDMKKTIKEFCLNNLDIEEVCDVYIYLHNYYNWDTTTEDMNKVLSVANDMKIPFNEICLYLFNYDKNELAKRYVKVIENKQKNEQNKIQKSVIIDDIENNY